MISFSKIAITALVATVLGLAVLAPTGRAAFVSADGGSKHSANANTAERAEIRRDIDDYRILSIIQSNVGSIRQIGALNTVARNGRLVATRGNSPVIALPDEDALKAALQVAELIDRVLSEMVGADINVEFVVDGDLFGSGRGEEENQTDDGVTLGGGTSNTGGHLPGGNTDDQNSGGSERGCDEERFNSLDSPLARGLMDGDDSGDGGDDDDNPNGDTAPDHVEDEDDDESNTPQPRNEIENRYVADDDSKKPEDKKDEDSGVDTDWWVNFFKGVAGALTGFFGGVAMSLPTNDEDAKNNANGIVGVARSGKYGTGNVHVAEQLRQAGMNDSPELGGSADPCEGYNWFRETLPHLTGTPWDPYARLDVILASDPTDSNPCGPNANPDPDGSCQNEESGEVEASGSRTGLSPDCDSTDGCGQVAVSAAQAEMILRHTNPAAPCGLLSNVGPDGDCENPGDNEDVPEPAGANPDCRFCAMAQMGTKASVTAIAVSDSTSDSDSTVAGLDRGMTR